MAGNQAETTIGILRDTIARYPERVALRGREGKAWRQLTWREFGQRVDAFAAALAAAGVGKGDRVAILSENLPEWVIADYGNVRLGATTVGIYPTLPAPQVAFILQDSGARVIVVQDEKQLAKALAAKADVPSLERILVIEGKAARDGAVAFDEFLASGQGQTLAEPEATPDDVAVLIYTSGTTGDPKGAMLTHRNLSSNVWNTLDLLRRSGFEISANDRFLAFLPLAHSFERIIHLLAIGSGASITYSQGARTLLDEMKSVQPTLMGCVPRVFEAMQERILDQVAKAPEGRQKLFRQALFVGRAVAEKRLARQLVPPLLTIQHVLFERLVYSKIRERFGGEFRLFISGGAALNPETAWFFHSIGFLLLEGYGLTETAPVISINPARRPKIGTVGNVIPGGEVKIAPDGEICYRGPNNMKGYWKNEKATAEMIDAEGWLHTGDVGLLDDEGYLKITDRKKDIIVLANGKNVAPQPIEQTIKQSPFVSEIVLIGDKQNIITALVIPNREKLKAWAKGEGLTAEDDAALFALPEAKRKIKQEIDAQSGALADFEKVKRFSLLDATFGIDSGELTPTLKVKRKVIASKYAKEIAALRGEGGE